MNNGKLKFYPKHPSGEIGDAQLYTETQVNQFFNGDKIDVYDVNDEDYMIGYGFSQLTGEIVESEVLCISGFIQINANEPFSIYITGSRGTFSVLDYEVGEGRYKIAFYDENKQWVETVNIVDTPYETKELTPTKNGFFRLCHTMGLEHCYRVYRENYRKISPVLVSEYDNKTVDLFMFMGQSNMAGRGITSSRHPEIAPTIIEGAGYEFRAISDPTQLYNIAEPFGVNENNANGIDEPGMKTGSMVTAFVNAYYQNNGRIPVIGVSASKGGSSITLWQPSQALLADAIDRLAKCTSYLKNKRYTIRHKYMLWCQGETDADRGITKEEYISYFESMLSEMINNGIEKLFMVRIGNCSVTDDLDRYTEMIQWQNEIAQNNKNVVMVSTVLAGMRDRGLMKDEFHYYQEGYNEVGTYAGINTAMYVNTGKEPTMYDSEDGSLYYSHKN